jgi:hypothetical protein
VMELTSAPKSKPPPGAKRKHCLMAPASPIAETARDCVADRPRIKARTPARRVPRRCRR